MKKNTFEEFKTYLYGKIFPNSTKQVKAIDVRESIETLADSLWRTSFINNYEDINCKISCNTSVNGNSFTTKIELTTKNFTDFVMPAFEVMPINFDGKTYIKPDKIVFLLKSNSNLASTGVFNFNDLLGENDGSTETVLNPSLNLPGSYALVEGSYDTDGTNGPGIPDTDTVDIDNISGVPFDKSTTAAYNTTYTMKNISASNLEMTYTGGGCVGDIVILINGIIL
jgi:hypothetical protein